MRRLTRHPFHSVRWRCCLALLCIALPIGGCAGQTQQTYDVTGTVTFEGEPVERGNVVFEDPSTGVAVQARLGSGGSYQVTLPAGSYLVSITPLLEEAPAGKNTPPDPDFERAENIPRKYWHHGTSGFTAEVGETQRAHDFQMSR